jgi:hypothetical protein
MMIGTTIQMITYNFKAKLIVVSAGTFITPVQTANKEIAMRRVDRIKEPEVQMISLNGKSKASMFYS